MEPVMVMRRLAFAGARRISKEGADRSGEMQSRERVTAALLR
jgi:hypothetical protein